MHLFVGRESVGLDGVTAVIFDLDGTLVETEHVWAIAKSEVARRYDRTPTEEDLAAFVGRSLSVFVKDFMEVRDEALSGKILHEMTGIAASKLPDMIRPLPGARDLVREAYGLGFRIAVCSSAPRWAIDEGLAALGVAELVELSVSAADMRKGKPDKQPYVDTLSALGLSPAEAIAFEDSPSGIASATSAGIATVAIGDHDPGLVPKGVKAVCASLAEVRLGIG